MTDQQRHATVEVWTVVVADAKETPEEIRRAILSGLPSNATAERQVCVFDADPLIFRH